jgi:hypothetical protein
MPATLLLLPGRAGHHHLPHAGPVRPRRPLEPTRATPQDYSADALSIFIETLPAIRNALAHGSAMLHPTVLGTFEIVADLVNQLYPVDAPAISSSVGGRNSRPPTVGK